MLDFCYPHCSSTLRLRGNKIGIWKKTLSRASLHSWAPSSPKTQKFPKGLSGTSALVVGRISYTVTSSVSCWLGWLGQESSIRLNRHSRGAYHCLLLFIGTSRGLLLETIPFLGASIDPVSGSSLDVFQCLTADGLPSQWSPMVTDDQLAWPAPGIVAAGWLITLQVISIHQGNRQPMWWVSTLWVDWQPTQQDFTQWVHQQPVWQGSIQKVNWQPTSYESTPLID